MTLWPWPWPFVLTITILDFVNAGGIHVSQTRLVISAFELVEFNAITLTKVTNVKVGFHFLFWIYLSNKKQYSLADEVAFMYFVVEGYNVIYQALWVHIAPFCSAVVGFTILCLVQGVNSVFAVGIAVNHAINITQSWCTYAESELTCTSYTFVWYFVCIFRHVPPSGYLFTLCMFSDTPGYNSAKICPPLRCLYDILFIFSDTPPPGYISEDGDTTDNQGMGEWILQTYNLFGQYCRCNFGCLSLSNIKTLEIKIQQGHFPNNGKFFKSKFS